MFDVLALIVLLIVLCLPATAFLIDRWGFERAGGN